jgi:hypothetical protein
MNIDEKYKKILKSAIPNQEIFQVSLTIDQIKTLMENEIKEEPESLFKTLQPDEFGISRLMADPLNNVPKMLEKFSAPRCIKDNIYIIQAECENSLGDKITLDYRYRASAQDEAIRQAQEFIQRINGRQKKVFEACWAMANDKSKRGIIDCDLTDLMSLIKPNRNKDSFSAEEKFEFFQDLLDLAATQLTLAKKIKQPKRKKDKIDKFLMPFITIHKTSDYNMISLQATEKYPNQILFSVLHNPLYEQETMYNVGAGIKRKTLEVHHEDIQLAEYIQIRKSQKMTNKFITFTDRMELLRLSRLSGIQHSGMANRKLLQKLERLKEKGIIINYPNKVTFPFHIKIR